MSNKKHILVAGGAGFIGSHLVDRLMQDENNMVIIVDSCVTGTIDNLQRWQIDGLQDRFLFVHATIQKYININKYRYPLHTIFNLASIASPPIYKKNAVRTLMVGALGSRNLLELAKTHNAQYIYASSSEIYGSSCMVEQQEQYDFGVVNPIGPRSMYDESKRFGEALAYHFGKQNNIDTKIARIYNTHGERMSPKDGRVIPNFIMAGLRNEPMLLRNEGYQTRSFCYVSDMVDALISMMDNDMDGAINVGNPDGYMTMKKLAQLVRHYIGVYKGVSCTSEIKENQWISDNEDPLYRKPSIKKAREILNWQPKISFQNGILKTIGWFDECNKQE